ncbi:hypothetical protein [Terribacillus halophilus]|nr:hypothetical protein [Terribacillus halophilus]
MSMLLPEVKDMIRRWCKRALLCTLWFAAMYVTWSQLTNLTVEDVIEYEQRQLPVHDSEVKQLQLQSKQQIDDKGDGDAG